MRPALRSTLAEPRELEPDLHPQPPVGDAQCRVDILPRGVPVFPGQAGGRGTPRRLHRREFHGTDGAGFQFVRLVGVGDGLGEAGHGM